MYFVLIHLLSCWTQLPRPKSYRIASACTYPQWRLNLRTLGWKSEPSSSAGARRLCSPRRAHSSSDVCQLAVWIPVLFPLPSLQGPSKLWEGEAPKPCVLPRKASKHSFTPILERRKGTGRWWLAQGCTGCLQQRWNGGQLSELSTAPLPLSTRPSFLPLHWRIERKKKKKKREGLHLQSFLTFHWQGFSFPLPLTPPRYFWSLSGSNWIYFWRKWCQEAWVFQE